MNTTQGLAVIDTRIRRPLFRKRSLLGRLLRWIGRSVCRL